MEIFQKYLQDFLHYLEVEKGYSPHTITAYHHDLLQFADFLGEETAETDWSFADVTYQKARYFLGYLQSQNLSKTSIARKTAALKSFFKFLKQDGILEENPVELLSTPKKPKHLPKVVTEVDLANFFQTFTDKTDPVSLRDCAIFELLYSSGLRVSELVALNVQDITENRVLCIRGKGSKERIVPIGRPALEAIKVYLAQGRILLDQQKDAIALFLNTRGQRLTTRGINYLLEHYIEKGALKYKMSPHVFRNSFATHLLDNGADLRVIQELLGHESLSTTQVYTEVSKAQLQHVYFKAHPRV